MGGVWYHILHSTISPSFKLCDGDFKQDGGWRGVDVMPHPNGYGNTTVTNIHRV